MKLALLSAVTALAFAATAAKADNFDFSYSVGGAAVKGTFVTTPDGVGRYIVTNILNGTRDGLTLTLDPPKSFMYPNYPVALGDNILNFPAFNTYVTFDGINYSAGGMKYNFYYGSGPTIYTETDGMRDVGATNVVVTRSVTAVPGPLSGAGLIPLAGLLGAALVRRRRSAES